MVEALFIWHGKFYHASPAMSPFRPAPDISGCAIAAQAQPQWKAIR
jgi:hypothetical protein